MMVPTISGNSYLHTDKLANAAKVAPASDEHTSEPAPKAVASSPKADKPAAKRTEPSPADLVKKLDETLKNTGIKSEVDTTNPGQVIVRLVDSSTGQLVLQIPSVTAIAIAEAIKKEASDSTASGALIDEAA